MMKYQNKTLDQVVLINKQIAERYMMCDQYRAMQWYCFYLSEVKKRSYLDCNQYHQCTPNSPLVPIH